MLQLANRVSLLEGSSKDPTLWPPRVDLAFIDGDHSLEGVQSDLDFAIARGAYCLVLHDTVSWWGPRQVLDWLQSKGFSMVQVNFDEGLTVAIRNLPKPPETYTQEKWPKGIVE